MKNNLLKNKLGMIGPLKKTIESDTKYKVDRIKELTGGSMNYVFKVETSQGTVVARIFAKNDFPDDKKLLWVDKALKKAGVNTARIIFCTRKNKPFRFGYMLTEFVEGRDGWSAIRNGDVSLQKYFETFGRLLKRIHAIRLSKNCPLKTSSPKGDYGWFRDVLRNFARKSFLSEKSYVRIQDFVINTLTRYALRCKKVLCHCDPGLQNHIYTKNGRIILIDWDLAEIDIFFRDFSVITIDNKKMDLFGKRQAVTRLIQKAFLRGYGRTGFTSIEIQRATDAHHIISHVQNALAYPPIGKGAVRYKRTTKEILKILGRYPYTVKVSLYLSCVILKSMLLLE